MYNSSGLVVARARAIQTRELAAEVLGRTLEAPIPKMSGLVKNISPFSKRKNPL